MMPRHQVMSRLSRYFNVLWMEPARSWRDVWGNGNGDSSPGAAFEAPPPDLPGFQVWDPSRRLPTFYRPRFVADLTRRARVLQGVSRLRKAGCERTVLYLWRPEFSYALDSAPYALSCYHVDDEYSFSTTEQPTSEEEAGLLRRADRVILHSPGLWETKAHLSALPAMVPNGVDYRAYSTPRDEPPELRNIPHPRIGYVGVVKRFLDMPLLLEVARRRRDYSFVILGPVLPLDGDQAPFDRLARLPNVHMLGVRAAQELPAYTQHLDVGIMPYDVDGYTKFIYPLKLHEYLAAGLPVVGTPIRTLQDFDGIISLATGPEEWCEALDEAVSPMSASAGRVAERRSVARSFDWGRITHRIAMILAEGLGERYLEIVESAEFAPEEWSHSNGGPRSTGGHFPPYDSPATSTGGYQSCEK